MVSHTVRQITLQPGEIMVISVAPQGVQPSEIDLCPECERNPDIFHGPPARSVTPPPSFTQAILATNANPVSSAILATNASLVSSAPTTSESEVIPPAEDPASSLPTPSPREDLVIGNVLPARTMVFHAYNRCPHPDELQRDWPLENHSKTYAVFRGSRIGFFPTWDIAQIFVLRVSRADHGRFKQFSDALKEYRRRFSHATLIQEIEVRPTVSNALFDFEDPRFDGDLKIVVPPNECPFAIPAEDALPTGRSY
ncbi:hypothetical protein K435DRAFT_881672, partial [Dendrothele bispora CBS 962.96]